MIKLVYKPVSMLVSVLGGVLAGAIFKQIWKLAAGEVLPAAALQGAVYAVVKAAVDRGAAEGTHKLTGVWPGENGQRSKKAA